MFNIFTKESFILWWWIINVHKKPLFIWNAEINWNYFTFLLETKRIDHFKGNVYLCLFWSLQNILHSFRWNYWSGKESFNFVSEIKQISVSLRTSSLKSNYLFLLGMRWLIIRFLVYFQMLLMKKTHHAMISQRELS